MKILICGMPRSMTTWAFNAVRELLSEQPLKTLWIDPSDTVAEAEFGATAENVLAKCHHYSDVLANSADFIVYSYRDIRSAAVSYFRKFSSDCSLLQLDTWIQAGYAWGRCADVILRYEQVEGDTASAVQMLRIELTNKYGAEYLSQENTDTVLSRIDACFAQRQAAEQIDYDPLTMILPAHRTFQPLPENLNEVERLLYERVQQEFLAWLVEHGYMHQEDHGQGLDYKLASDILSHLAEPTVIDVGAERGSFVELALSANAKKVIAFEVLPRHVKYLCLRFADEKRVEVFALAVSNHSGKAIFHIALDPEGHELDYHHTLADLGDSTSVVRSTRSLEVEAVTLGELAAHGQLPSTIDFLKVDADGHDLSVLHGLGDICPRFILAEYWDTLPETSGRNLYTLADLECWAEGRGYVHSLVIRRNGRLESLEWDAPWTQPGDWGNVLFIRDAVDLSLVRSVAAELAPNAQRANLYYVSTLIKEFEAKEAEIRRLDNALQELRWREADQKAMQNELELKEAVIQQLKTAHDAAQMQLVEKDAAIGELKAAHDAAQTQLVEKDAAIGELKVAHDAAQTQLAEKDKTVRALTDITQALSTSSSLQANHAMIRGLEEKEVVIQELSKALEAYRAALSLQTRLLSPFNHCKQTVEKLTTRLRASLVPRLGNLNQYPPRPMVLPRHYAKPIVLSATPKVSIVTPSYNQADYIGRTIESVLGQQYPNLEYFVQDGGSSDGTVDVLKGYGERLQGWESRPDGGQSQAINLGFAKTSGEIMAWLNSDDLLLPGALAYVVDYFNRYTEVDVVYGNRLLIDENEMEIGRWIMPGHDGKVLSWVDYVPQETLFWRRRIWDKVGGQIDESFRFAMDWDLLIRFRDAGARFAHMPRFLGAFRIHEHQKTSAAINEVGHKEMDRIRERLLGRVPSYKEIRRGILPFMLKHTMVDMAYGLRVRISSKRSFGISSKCDFPYEH